jgi:hypothetical protein
MFDGYQNLTQDCLENIFHKKPLFEALANHQHPPQKFIKYFNAIHYILKYVEVNLSMANNNLKT